MPAPNYGAALDAAFALCSRIWRHGRVASEHGCWASSARCRPSRR
jgi:hypothetical protein